MKIQSTIKNILLLSSFTRSTNAFTTRSQNTLSYLHRASLQATPEALTEAWTTYNTLLETSPLLTKSVTACGILGAADLAGQVLENKLSDDEDKPIDVARFIRFAIFGLVLQAPWNHYYYQVLDGVLPPTEEPFTSTTAVKVVIDQFVQAPVFTVLIFYFLGLLEGKAVENIQQQLKDDYTDTMLANCKYILNRVMNLICYSL